jgi:hypothetical protein
MTRQRGWIILSTSFTIVLLATYFYTGVISDLPKRPQSVHQWAQCDRGSVARSFADMGMNPALPQINGTETGNYITGLEFPVVNYLAAISYRLFGFNELWYRLINLLIVTAGFVCSFLLARKLTGNLIGGFIPVMLWMLSPILFYYIPNFLPDTASLGFIMAGWFFFFRYRDNPDNRNLILFTIMAMMAALIKLTALISVLVIMVCLVIDWFNGKLKGSIPLLRHRKEMFFACLTAVTAAGYWYNYASWLSAYYRSKAFFFSSLPPISIWQFKEHSAMILENWGNYYYPNPVVWGLAISGLIMLALYRYCDRLLGLITLGLYAGAAVFFYVMFNQFIDHDYYFIGLTPAVFFQLVTFSKLVNQGLKKKQLRISLALLGSVLVLSGIQICRNHHTLRYHGWMADAGKNFTVYYDLEPYLRELGIEPTDKVLSAYDFSLNITLYLMNQRGWPVSPNHTDSHIKRVFAAKPEYAVLNDATFAEKEPFKKYFRQLIGQKEHLRIYKISY